MTDRREARSDPRLDRRDFLRLAGGGAAAASLLLDPLGRRLLAAAPARKTRHVVVVAFAGGVRSKETIESPDNVPNLMRLAGRGVLMPNVRAQNVGHYGAALSVFTGRTEVFGIRENSRSDHPTLFEYVRRSLALAANGAWLSTSGGDQQLNYAYGTHPRYGSRFGANLIAADGVFNAEFKDILEQFGRPELPGEQEGQVLDRLRGALAEQAPRAPGLAQDPAHQREIERFILGEISGRTTRLTGPGAADAKALRVATNILRVFRPTLLGVALNQADVAHQSFNGYVEIIRRNDAELGKLIDAIDADPQLKDSTAIFVLPEFGRDRDLNQRSGLDHGDGSEELQRVALVAAGPEVRAGRVAKETADTIDVCPTVAHLLGARAEFARGRVLKGILA